MSDLVFEIKVRSSSDWVKVRYDIFRSWTGARQINGHPYNGPVFTLGEGLPNPTGPADADAAAEREIDLPNFEHMSYYGLVDLLMNDESWSEAAEAELDRRYG